MSVASLTSVGSVAVACEAGALVFQRWDDTWMVDHIGAMPAVNDDDMSEADFCDDAQNDGVREEELGSTSVSLDEVEHLSEIERRGYLQRQLRKLGVAPRSRGAALLWRLVKDPAGFVP